MQNSSGQYCNYIQVNLGTIIVVMKDMLPSNDQYWNYIQFT